MKLGNYLEYVVQPTVLALASYTFYKKGMLPGRITATMFVVSSIASGILALKSSENPDKIYQIQFKVRSGAVALSMLLFKQLPYFRFRKNYLFPLLGLGATYILIAKTISAIAYQIYKRAEEQSPASQDKTPSKTDKKQSKLNVSSPELKSEPLFQHKECTHQAVQEELAKGIHLITQKMLASISNSWKAIQEQIESQHNNMSQFLFNSSNYAPRGTANSPPRTFQYLSPENQQKVVTSLARQGITLLNRKVFALKSYPNLIFKQVEKASFDILLDHQCVCKTFNLDLLVVPSSRWVEIDGFTFIVQQRLKYFHAKQPYYYIKYADRVHQAVLQLKTYIEKTGEADVEWRNMPIIGDLKKELPLQIGLIDHEELPGDKPAWGIIGYEKLHRRGLIGLLCEEQAREIAQLAKPSLGDEVDRALNKRVKELQEWEVYRTYRVWAKENNRKSKNPIPGIPSNVEVLNAFNQALAKRNPKEYTFRYELRTIPIQKSVHKEHKADERRSLETELKELKDKSIIYAYSFFEIKVDPFSMSFADPRRYNPDQSLIGFTITA